MGEISAEDVLTTLHVHVHDNSTNETLRKTGNTINTTQHNFTQGRYVHVCETRSLVQEREPWNKTVVYALNVCRVGCRVTHLHLRLHIWSPPDPRPASLAAASGEPQTYQHQGSSAGAAQEGGGRGTVETTCTWTLYMHICNSEFIRVEINWNYDTYMYNVHVHVHRMFTWQQCGVTNNMYCTPRTMQTYM